METEEFKIADVTKKINEVLEVFENLKETFADNLSHEQVQGIGYIAKALSEVILDKNYSGALKNALAGLGMLGVHTQIQQALEATSATGDVEVLKAPN